MSADTDAPVAGRALAPHVFVVVLAVLLVVADQWTKHSIVDLFAARGIELPVAFQRVDPIPMMGGIFHLRIQENTGGAFSVLSGPGRVSVFLLVTSVLALGFIGWYYWCYRDSPWMRLALAFIAGGAVGNLIDRVRLRYVVDFIDVDIGAYQWPFFNLADMFICTGAGMLAAYIIRYRRQPEPEPEPADGET
jgi:signal peptidase II